MRRGAWRGARGGGGRGRAGRGGAGAGARSRSAFGRAGAVVGRPRSRGRPGGARLLRARARVCPFCARRGSRPRAPASRDGFAPPARPARDAAGRGCSAGARTRGAGATGAAAAAGSRGGGGDRRGQSTTRATTPAAPTRRATLPQRTRRSSESDGIDRSRDRAGRIRPLLSCAAAHGCSCPDLRPHAPARHDRARRPAREDPRRRRGDGHERRAVVSKHDWGPRTMAYEIRHKTDAEYHLLQFHGDAPAAGEPPAHAADHRRRRALPHHQARARHAGPAAEARARAGEPAEAPAAA